MLHVADRNQRILRPRPRHVRPAEAAQPGAGGRAHRALGPAAPRKPGAAFQPRLSGTGGSSGAYYFGAACSLTLVLELSFQKGNKVIFKPVKATVKVMLSVENMHINGVKSCNHANASLQDLTPWL